MPKLDDPVRAFIVQSLACYDTPTQVAERVKTEFGIALRRHQVQIYDPTKAAGQRSLAKKWVALFHATRERFLERVSEIPIAHQAARLRSLQCLLDRAIEKGNTILVLRLLEQAAKEVGGAYIDRRRVDGDALQPVGARPGVEVEHPLSLTDAELERIARG